MKRILYFTLSLAVLFLANGCSKDDEKASNSLSLNTWHIDNLINNSKDDVFTLTSSTFSTQGHQLLQIYGETNGSNVCVLQFYFNTIGPPPTGGYTVVDTYAGLSATTQNAVYIMVGFNQRTWVADPNQTVHAIFANGSLDMKINGLNIFNASNSTAINAHTKLSANLRKTM